MNDSNDKLIENLSFESFVNRNSKIHHSKDA